MEQSVYISTDKSKIDLNFVHDYLSNKSYWAKGRTLEIVKKSIDNSLCFGIYERPSENQIGFARATSDSVVFAWVMDVFIAEDYRGKGYSKLLMEAITNHPDLSTVKGFGLRTSDGHGLYKQFGFTEIPEPETWMYKKN